MTGLQTHRGKKEKPTSSTGILLVWEKTLLLKGVSLWAKKRLQETGNCCQFSTGSVILYQFARINWLNLVVSLRPWAWTAEAWHETKPDLMDSSQTGSSPPPTFAFGIHDAFPNAMSIGNLIVFNNTDGGVSFWWIGKTQHSREGWKPVILLELNVLVFSACDHSCRIAKTKLGYQTAKDVRFATSCKVTKSVLSSWWRKFLLSPFLETSLKTLATREAQQRS